MSFLYRHGLTVTRKQPYLDWANGLDDGGPNLSEALARDRRTIYLLPESDEPPPWAALLDEFWQHIFEEELAAWIIAEDRWPQPRTREMFDAWFDVEMTDAVYDLTPEEPLTQTDVDRANMQDAVGRCAWCELDLDGGEGRYAGFKLADRHRFAVFSGRVLPLSVDDECVVLAIVTLEDSGEAQAGDDVLVRVCSSRCEKAVRKIVPKALRRLSHRLEDRVGSAGVRPES